MTKAEARPAWPPSTSFSRRALTGFVSLSGGDAGDAGSGDDGHGRGARRASASAARLGYRSGYYSRTLVTRVGKLELRVPQDREGRFSTELFERYQRSEQALVATLAEMYVQGVSTRKVKAITEELCGHAFSASAISAINKTAGRKPRRLCQPPPRRALSLPHPRRPL